MVSIRTICCIAAILLLSAPAGAQEGSTTTDPDITTATPTTPPPPPPTVPEPKSPFSGFRTKTPSGGGVRGAKKLGPEYYRAAATEATILVFSQAGERSCLASGVIVGAGGIALTSSSAICGDAKEVHVFLRPVGKELRAIRADVVTADAGDGLAVLALPQREAKYPFLRMDRNGSCNSEMFVVGHPESPGMWTVASLGRGSASALPKTIGPEFTGGPVVCGDGRLLAVARGEGSSKRPGWQHARVRTTIAGRAVPARVQLATNPVDIDIIDTTTGESVDGGAEVIDIEPASPSGGGGSDFEIIDTTTGEPAENPGTEVIEFSARPYVLSGFLSQLGELGSPAAAPAPAGDPIEALWRGEFDQAYDWAKRKGMKLRLFEKMRNGGKQMSAGNPAKARRYFFAASSGALREVALWWACRSYEREGERDRAELCFEKYDVHPPAGVH